MFHSNGRIWRDKMTFGVYRVLILHASHVQTVTALSFRKLSDLCQNLPVPFLFLFFALQYDTYEISRCSRLELNLKLKLKVGNIFALTGRRTTEFKRQSQIRPFDTTRRC